MYMYHTRGLHSTVPPDRSTLIVDSGILITPDDDTSPDYSLLEVSATQTKKVMLLMMKFNTFYLQYVHVHVC